MTNQQIYQWNEHYPNRNAFENDVQRGELYVYAQNNICIGCIVITTIKDVEYVPIEWLTKDKNIYIHRLAVHPKYQGKGIAQQMMTLQKIMQKQMDIFLSDWTLFHKINATKSSMKQEGINGLEISTFQNKANTPSIVMNLCFNSSCSDFVYF